MIRRPPRSTLFLRRPASPSLEVRMDLLRRKSVTDLQNEALTDHSLKRALGALNLTLLGIGAIIGTGIFVLTGTVAAVNAGPAVVLSFILAGIASIFAALCYSEFASLVPMAGSAYTYGYATLGEIFAWIIGWDLVLEYALGAVTVAIGWSGYGVALPHHVGLGRACGVAGGGRGGVISAGTVWWRGAGSCSSPTSGSTRCRPRRRRPRTRRRTCRSASSGRC